MPWVLARFGCETKTTPIICLVEATLAARGILRNSKSFQGVRLNRSRKNPALS